MEFLVDEGFDRRILRGLLRRTELSYTTVQAAGLSGAPDELLLDVAAEHGMVILTHDEATLVPLAWARVERGKRMPGLVVVPWSLSIRQSISDLELLLVGAREDEFDRMVWRLPL